MNPPKVKKIDQQCKNRLYLHGMTKLHYIPQQTRNRLRQCCGGNAFARAAALGFVCSSNQGGCSSGDWHLHPPDVQLLYGTGGPLLVALRADQCLVVRLIRPPPDIRLCCRIPARSRAWRPVSGECAGVHAFDRRKPIVAPVCACTRAAHGTTSLTDFNLQWSYLRGAQSSTAGVFHGIYH